MGAQPSSSFYAFLSALTEQCKKHTWLFLEHAWAVIISTERWLMLLSCVTMGRKHLFFLFYWQSASISLIKYLLGSSLSSSPLIWCHVVVPDWIYVQHQASADLLFITPVWFYSCHVEPNTSTPHTKHTGFMTSCAHFSIFCPFFSAGLHKLWSSSVHLLLTLYKLKAVSQNGVNLLG